MNKRSLCYPAPRRRDVYVYRERRSMTADYPESIPLKKVPTGIDGLDDITFGGLPQGRPTLVVGNAGSGKTMMAMEFIVRGATEYDEPGVFVAFEETPKDLSQNFASRGWDLKALQEQNKLAIDYIYIERSEIEETGEYDLEGLFIRLGHSIDKIGAKRIVLDTIEVLFSGLANEALLRAELRRLFRWIKDKGVTAVVTGERGEDTLTRYGLEEYVADCVIVLDHRIIDQIATRRLRIMKYRGSMHGTNEYPFLIEDDGISVLPISSLRLDHDVSNERISTGIPGLDAMMGNKGFYRGSSALVSGTAGTGKTSIAAGFVNAACKRGEKCLYFAFEESTHQIMRNMSSIGYDLAPWIEKGLLKFHAGRPTQYGLEMHLASMVKMVEQFQPAVVVMDPISNLIAIGQSNEVKSMLSRLIDYLKASHITALFTHLTGGEQSDEARDVGVSSLMDTWISLRNFETNGERTRGLYVLKSRGIAHSNQVREFQLTNEGVRLLDVYIGPDGVLTGTSRVLQQVADRATTAARQQAKDSKLREMERKRELLEAQISAMRAEFEASQESLKREIVLQEARDLALAEDRAAVEESRQGSAATEQSGEEE